MYATRFRIVQRDKNFFVVYVTCGGGGSEKYQVTTTSDGDVLLANCEDQALGDAIVAVVTEILRLTQ